MRHLLAAAAFTLATADASAGPADVFLGRPPSIGVVQGGAFGADGTDYLGETRRGRVFPAPRAGARLARAAGTTRPAPAPVLARPYRP